MDKATKVSTRERGNPFRSTCTIYGDVLAYWSNQRRLAINLTVFNRYPVHDEVGKIVGDFTSLILLDVDVKPEQNFFTRVKENAIYFIRWP